MDAGTDYTLETSNYGTDLLSKEQTKANHCNKVQAVTTSSSRPGCFKKLKCFEMSKVPVLASSKSDGIHNLPEMTADYDSVNGIQSIVRKSSMQILKMPVCDLFIGAGANWSQNPQQGRTRDILGIFTSMSVSQELIWLCDNQIKGNVDKLVSLIGWGSQF